MPELPDDQNEDSLYRVVWSIVTAHRQERPELYCEQQLDLRLRELGIVIGELIGYEVFGSQRPEMETAKRAGNLAAIATGQVTQAVLLHLHRLRLGAGLFDRDPGDRKPS